MNFVHSILWNTLTIPLHAFLKSCKQNFQKIKHIPFSSSLSKCVCYGNFCLFCCRKVACIPSENRSCNANPNSFACKPSMFAYMSFGLNENLGSCSWMNEIDDQNRNYFKWLSRLTHTPNMLIICHSRLNIYLLKPVENNTNPIRSNLSANCLSFLGEK